jgi:hypothetical protein
MQEAAAVGAKVRFIDLPFAAQVLVDQSDRLTGRVATLLGEQWFQRSAYLRRLAASLGCRDVDELWDRLFESWARDLSTEAFVSQVATYCDLARRGAVVGEHDRDATTARESEMAWHVTRAREERPGDTILVVTGGYHSVALPDLVAAGAVRPDIDLSEAVNAETILIRYSFDRLDRANGYGAGMPSPAFYQRLWESSDTDQDVSLGLLLEISHRAREQGLDGAPTTVSVIAALEQAHRLAALRGNRRPTRADLLDGVDSCYLQSAPQGEGRQLAVVTRTLFTGTSVGRVPSAAGLPPIVGDFYSEARACGLKAEDSESRQLALDIYADARSRRVSRLLHRLQFLDIPFASKLSGPSFTARHVGRRLREVWRYGWSPQTESALIDAAAYGSTIAEAATQRFTDSLLPTADAGTSRSAETAAERLSLACVLGLHAVVPGVVAWLSISIHEDPHFESVAAALHRLVALWQGREPLEADTVADLPALGRAAFERAAYLAGDLGGIPKDRATEVAAALVSLREVLTGDVAAWFDPALLWTPVERLAAAASGQSRVLGAAAGMLYSAGRLDDGEIHARLQGRLSPLGSAQNLVDYLHGMLLAARELAWQSQSVLTVMRALVESSEEDAFVGLLPALRLALSALTPSETDRVAQVVGSSLGLTTIGSTVEYSLVESEVQRNLETASRLRSVLERDGLGSWLTGRPEVPRER